MAEAKATKTMTLGGTLVGEKLRRVQDLTVEMHTDADIAEGNPPTLSTDVDIEDFPVQAISITKNSEGEPAIVLDFGCCHEPWYILIDAATLAAMNEVAREASMVVPDLPTYQGVEVAL
jgi:hypothetical protein